MTPYPLLWLRYSTFIFLYPLGVASEMTMVWLALPHIRRTHMWSIDMPNIVNFAFDYFLLCLLAVVIYIPGGTVYGAVVASICWIPSAMISAQSCMQVFRCCICTCSIKERRYLASQSLRQLDVTAKQCVDEQNVSLLYLSACHVMIMTSID